MSQLRKPVGEMERWLNRMLTDRETVSNCFARDRDGAMARLKERSQAMAAAMEDGETEFKIDGFRITIIADNH